jgi:23S rRNA pseudouridine1911/1915/1917 synthase
VTDAGSIPDVICAATDDAGKRLDQFLVTRLQTVSRARVQELISEGKVLVNGVAAKASLKLRGGERISVLGEAQRAPLRAIAEEIPLDIVYEDDDLAVINKPAGMMVHAGAGATDDVRNRGTLVNALLHHFGSLSGVGGEIRPGIVHRLDKETSGLIVVAKNDEAHRRLAAQFAQREVKKIYTALVHGWVKKDNGTVAASISRDRVRRTRMTTRAAGGREAISHYRVARRLDTEFGKFTLVEVKIDTGRTHQIRVHMASLGHPVVGDTVYGAPGELRYIPPFARNAKDVAPSPRLAKATRPFDKLRAGCGAPSSTDGAPAISLARNFLHAAELTLRHPRTGEKIALKSALPGELREFLARLERPA